LTTLPIRLLASAIEFTGSRPTIISGTTRFVSGLEIGSSLPVMKP